MTEPVPRSSAQALPPAYRAREFFLARQPVLDRRQRLVAYELLFRSTDAAAANVTNDIFATASVIAHASELGLHSVLGQYFGFINVDASVLLSDFIRFLPKDKVVLEVLETVEVTPELLARVGHLQRDGYRFALDDVVAETEHVERLLPLVDIVKLDLAQLAEDELVQLCHRFKARHKIMLAEKVESQAQFERGAAAGCDYFQGFYFARPVILRGRRLSPSQLAIVRLLAQVTSNAPLQALEETLKRDATLGLGLLRFMNRRTAHENPQPRIESISQALAVLDRCELYRWLQVLLHSEIETVQDRSTVLLTLATTRGRLMELLARKIRPGKQDIADVAFTAGLLSLVDALFDMPFAGILQHVEVSAQIRDALMHRSGLFGEMLTLVESVERVKEAGARIPALLKQFGLTVEDLNALQVAAFEWSNTVAEEGT